MLLNIFTHHTTTGASSRRRRERNRQGRPRNRQHGHTGPWPAGHPGQHQRGDLAEERNHLAGGERHR